MSEDIFVCHLVHSAPRGEGWYWWPSGFDEDKSGPFKTEAEAHHDIFLLSCEAGEREI